MMEKTIEAESTMFTRRTSGEDQEFEIDLVEVGYLLLGKLQYLLLCFLAGAVLLNAYAYFCITPTYTSTSKLYVVSSSSDSVVDLTDLNIGNSLTSDYEELILSYPMLDIVIDDLDLDISSDELSRLIELNNPSDTRILEIAVTTADPQLSMDIANEVVEAATEYLPKTMSTMAPNIAQEAKLAEHKAGPSYLHYTLIGAVLGLVLCCTVLIVMYLMDDTIHSGEELERCFGYVPLTEIPTGKLHVDEEPKEKKKFSKRSRLKKGERTHEKIKCGVRGTSLRCGRSHESSAD